MAKNHSCPAGQQRFLAGLLGAIRKMKNILLLIISIFLIACQNESTGRNIEEFESKIESVENSNIQNKKLEDGWYAPSQEKNDFMKIDPKTSKETYIDPRPIILPENISSFEEFENYEGSKGVAIYFEETGIEAWAQATDKLTGSSIIFILDNEILTVQQVNSKITNGASAFWKSDLDDQDWKRIMKMVKNN